MESEEHFLEEGFKKSEIEAGQEIFSGNKPEKTQPDKGKAVRL